MTNWMIIASGPDKVEEIRRTPDSILSMKDALDGVDILLVQYSQWCLTLLRQLSFAK